MREFTAEVTQSNKKTGTEKLEFHTERISTLEKEIALTNPQ